jgi:hypothetical protein
MIELTPFFQGYTTKQLGQKYFGGRMLYGQLIQGSYYYARYIDTTDLDVSIWVSNMDMFDGNYNFRCDIEILGSPNMNIWSKSSSLIDNTIVNGYNFPRTVFDLGQYQKVRQIRFSVTHPTIRNNYEFFLWKPSQIIRLY